MSSNYNLVYSKILSRIIRNIKLKSKKCYVTLIYYITMTSTRLRRIQS